jgi:hypothetical protein
VNPSSRQDKKRSKLLTKEDEETPLKKEARGIDDADFGEVQEVSNGMVLTQRGIVNKVLFSIPQSVVESYDGEVLRFRLSEIEAVDKYQKLFEPKPIEIETRSDTEIDSVSTNTDSRKINGVIDEAIDDTIKDVLIEPTKEEEELEIEKKVEKEVAVLNEESGIKNENIDSVSANETTQSENTVNPSSRQDKKRSKLLTKEDEETPLKKEEAGIS